MSSEDAVPGSSMGVFLSSPPSSTLSPGPLPIWSAPTPPPSKPPTLHRSVLSDSLRPHGLYPTRFPCPWDSPGRSTGVGCRLLLQGIFPTQRQSPGLMHGTWPLYRLIHQGSPPSPLPSGHVECHRGCRTAWAPSGSLLRSCSVSGPPQAEHGGDPAVHEGHAWPQQADRPPRGHGL